jgi:hypothetical protein
MAIHIRRQEFIGALGSAALPWPLTAHAQPSQKLARIGFVVAATPSTWKDWVSAFVQRLRELTRSDVVAYSSAETLRRTGYCYA